MTKFTARMIAEQYPLSRVIAQAGLRELTKCERQSFEGAPPDAMIGEYEGVTIIFDETSIEFYDDLGGIEQFIIQPIGAL